MRSILVMDEMIATWRSNTLSSMPLSAICFLALATPGSIPRMPCIPPMRFIWLQLIGEVIQIEDALGHLLGHGFRLGVIQFLGGLFNQRDHIALTEDTSRHALGVEHFQRVDLFPGAEEFDRQAGDMAHGQRRAASPIAVGAGEDEAL